MNESAPATPVSRPWYQRIGPGLITACVVIGPGSILTSSTVGANNAYSMLWIVAVSVVFMMFYMTMGARLGVLAEKAPGDLIRERAGKWLSILVGVSVFFISAAFQSGNNIGVGAAFEAFIDNKDVVACLIVGFNVIAISFLFLFRNLYQMLERLMMVFVGLMLVSFAINLLRLKPDVGAMAQGFIPSFGNIDIAVLGLVGTTFVITAAYYQAYLVRQKGWKEPELKSGLIDARIGSGIMFLITLMLVSTAAAGIYNGQPVKLASPVAVAVALEPTFGQSGKIIFCFGLFSAAYSSFLVNSMIGGFILADSLGLGSKPTDLWPRLLTTAALLTGMIVALATMLLGFDRTPTIIAAQAVTVLGAPLIAVVLLWLTSREDVMGQAKNGVVLKAVGGLGLVLLLAMAYRTAFVSIPATWDKWMNPPTAMLPTKAVSSVSLPPENRGKLLEGQAGE
ncbi:MAG: Nramp family divalent metal transporter [Planctomycetota bacterium]|nr:Nramp family divalent metal transporter [Planctomycetota bacterium]MDA0918635.1 Nramp family divalent metal transporter [Planctomycetota bacterium]